MFSILLMDICQRFIPTLIMKPPIVKLFLVWGIFLYEYNDLTKLLEDALVGNDQVGRKECCILDHVNCVEAESD